MDKPLGLGKVNRNTLDTIVFPHTPLCGKPSLDANVIGEDTAISLNVAVGTPLDTLGFFAFHYAASNVAMRFAKPSLAAAGIYLPLGSTERELETIATGFGEEAKKYHVKVAAGHVGTYRGVASPLVSVTCLGKIARRPDRPSQGDRIVVAGHVGKEAVWLKALGEGRTQEGNESFWRLTPLPLAASLRNTGGVKLMHDVSEGGVAGALHEVAESLSLRLSIRSGCMPFYEGAKDLSDDPLRIPSYGSLIVVASEEGLGGVERQAKRLSYPYAVVGRLERGKGLFIDEAQVKAVRRTRLDEIYGAFLDTGRAEPEKR